MTTQSKILSRPYVLILSVFNIVIVLLALSGVCSVGAEDNWFARSGSIVTIGTITLELLIVRQATKNFQFIRALAPQADESSKQDAPVNFDPRPYLNTLQKSSSIKNEIALLVNMAFGTIIWGYGDLIYLCLFPK